MLRSIKAHYQLRVVCQRCSRAVMPHSDAVALQHAAARCRLVRPKRVLEGAHRQALACLPLRSAGLRSGSGLHRVRRVEVPQIAEWHTRGVDATVEEAAEGCGH